MTPSLRPPYSALVDSWTNALLALNTNGALIADAARYIPDSFSIANVDRPHYIRRISIFNREPFFLLRADTATYPEWRWDVTKRIFVPMHKHLVTEELRARSKEAILKVSAIEKITSHTNIAREELRTGTYGEESLHYMYKEQSARFLKDPTVPVADVPLVFQWAHTHKLTVLQAARDLQLMEKIYEQKLIRSEALYQKFVTAIRAAKPEEIARLNEEFIQEYYINAFV